MITLKIRKAICPVCDVKNSNSVLSVSGKLITLGSFQLKIKIERKWKLDNFLFYEESNSKIFKNY